MPKGKDEIQIDGNKKCSRCNQTLKVFTVTKNWKGRKLHKKCYEEQELIEWFNLQNERYQTNFEFDKCIGKK